MLGLVVVDLLGLVLACLVVDLLGLVLACLVVDLLGLVAGLPGGGSARPGGLSAGPSQRFLLAGGGAEPGEREIFWPPMVVIIIEFEFAINPYLLWLRQFF